MPDEQVCQYNNCSNEPMAYETTSGETRIAFCANHYHCYVVTSVGSPADD